MSALTNRELHQLWVDAHHAGGWSQEAAEQLYASHVAMAEKLDEANEGARRAELDHEETIIAMDREAEGLRKTIASLLEAGKAQAETLELLGKVVA